MASIKAMVAFSLVAAAGLLFLLLAWSGGAIQARADGSDVSAQEMVADTLPCTSPSESPNFEVYGLGEAFEGLELAEVLRRCDIPYPGEPVSANYVSYIYGDCDLGQVGDDRVACQPPLEIQSWPSCHRSRADYQPGMVKSATTPLSDLNGAQRLAFRNDRIEVYTGRTTVVLLSTNLRLLLDATDQLGRQDLLESTDWVKSRQNGESRRGGIAIHQDSVRAPADGATEGTLTCA